MSGGIPKLFLVLLFLIQFLLRASAASAAAVSSDGGMLYVKSEPPGARVLVDGEERGTTPTFIRNVRPGHRVVELRAPAGPVRREVVTVEAGKIAKLKVVMSLAPAVLTVISDPLEATVLLDGRDRGETPLTVERVRPGPHEVVIHKQGYKGAVRSVELSPGERHVLEVGLRPEGEADTPDGIENDLTRVLGEFETFIEKGDYVGARRFAERHARGRDLAEVRAAAKVARALEGRREAIRRGAEALVGEEVTFRTKAGPRKGKVEKVTDEGISLSTRIRARGRVMGETRFSVAWNDLAPAQEELLAKGWDGDSPDGKIALAFLALARRDLVAAGRAVHAAQSSWYHPDNGGRRPDRAARDRPLAAYVRGRIRALKRAPAEAAARKMWGEIEKLTQSPDVTPAQAAKLLAQLRAFERRYGRTEHAASVNAKIPEAREAARLALARAAGAPPDAVGYGGHWYKLFDEHMSWHEAKTFCEQRGGHLVTITSEEESDFVTDLARAAGVNAWIGLTDEEQEGEWEWVTGEEVTFTAWAPGEPNNMGGAQHYARLWRGRGFSWDDEKATGQQGPTPFICEWDSARRTR